MTFVGPFKRRFSSLDSNLIRSQETTEMQPTRAASPQIIRAHVWISGRVQGVGYRAATCDVAAVLKLNGWVRNRQDGRVEAVFEGSKSQVEAMLRWCHQGPPAAVVQTVERTIETPEGLQGFDLLRSA
jgi:acylphosphatase